jgi:hypothetical protein
MIAGKLDRLLLETGKVKAIRFALLDALCRELRCQPGDLFGHVEKAAPPPSLPYVPRAVNASIDFIDCGKHPR